MARTHKTSHIKQQMAEQAREEEEAKEAEEARRERIRAARTRSQKSAAMAKAAEERNARGPHVLRSNSTNNASEEGADGDDVEKADAEDVDTGEEERNDGARVNRKRTASDLEEEALVTVPPFIAGQRSWEDFEVALKDYMKRTSQVLVVMENINVRRRNKTLRAQKQYKDKPDDEIPLVPAVWKLYQRKYICTHGWGERERSKTGKRKFHKLRRAGCPFQFLAQLAQDSVGEWDIQLRREDYRHNHNVGTNIYRHYPGIRKMLRSIISLIAGDA